VYAYALYLTIYVFQRMKHLGAGQVQIGTETDIRRSGTPPKRGCNCDRALKSAACIVCVRWAVLRCASGRE